MDTYAIVRYSRYGLEDEGIEIKGKAGANIICTCFNEESATSKFKELVDDVDKNPNLIILNKDLKLGKCTYKSKSGNRMMLVKMPYTAQKLECIDL